MTTRRWIGLALGCSLSLAPVLLAQESNCQRRIIPVSVADQNGSPVRDLTAADFQATFGGKPVKIVSVLPDDHPHRIVILIDASGSMRGGTGRRWGTTAAAAQEFVQSDTENSSFALWIFGEKVDERIGFSQGKTMVADRLRQVRNDVEFVQKHVRGATALYDSVFRALELFGPLSPGDIIYVFTDGADNSSRTRAKELRRLLVSNGVRLFVCFSLVDPWEHTEKLLERQKMPLKELQELAFETGGGFFGPIGQDAHGKLMRSLGDDDLIAVRKGLETFNQRLTQSYRVEVDFGTATDKPREWKLRVVGRTGAERKEFRVAYPIELLPCSGSVK